MPSQSPIIQFLAVVALIMASSQRVSVAAFQARPSPPRSRLVLLSSKQSKEIANFQPPGIFEDSSPLASEKESSPFPVLLAAATTAALVTPESAHAAATTAGPIPSGLMAYAHFLGILGVIGGLSAERFLIRRNMTQEDEDKISVADLIYGLSAFSLLITGYFRVTEYAKGWDFYKNEPLFWFKMASVAVLGGLSFFPAIVFFLRDQARKNGAPYVPLSDESVDRLTTILNAEILAVLTIPLLATLMARGVFYIDGFPWAIGVGLYALGLGGAGFKYVTEAFALLEKEKALGENLASDE